MIVALDTHYFKGSPHARAVLRGRSAAPLYVTAVGLDVDDAATHVRRMHGDHRVPTLLRRLDHLCRERLERR